MITKRLADRWGHFHRNNIIMKIFLIRHAESTFNVWKATLNDDEKTKHPLLGHRDSEITDIGREQCQRLRHRLAQEDRTIFDAVVISTLKRTKQTLEGIKIESRRGGVLVTPLCREFAIDECDFLAEEEIVLETKEQLYQRIEDFKAWLHKECEGCESVAVVTHSDFIYYACNPHCSDDKEALQPRIGNCDYVVVDW